MEPDLLAMLYKAQKQIEQTQRGLMDHTLTANQAAAELAGVWGLLEAMKRFAV